MLSSIDSEPLREVLDNQTSVERDVQLALGRQNREHAVEVSSVEIVEVAYRELACPYRGKLRGGSAGLTLAGDDPPAVRRTA